MNILVVIRLSGNESIDECVPLMWAKKMKQQYNADVYCLVMDAKEKEKLYYKCFDYGVKTVYMLSDIRFAASDTFVTSKILYNGMKRIGKDFDIIITSYLSKFGETSHVPVSLAAWNDIPFSINVTDIKCKKDGLICTEELGECSQEIDIHFPALIAVSNAQNTNFFTQNQLTLFDLMQRKEKDIQVFTLDDLCLKEEECGKQGSHTDVVRSKKLSASREHIVLDEGMDELWIRLNKEISLAT